MIIEELENKAPHILKMARENLSEIKFGSHTVDEEIEQSTPEYLIAYAYHERGISIPDCVVLLSDYRRLQKINVVEWWNQIILLNGQQNDTSCIIQNGCWNLETENIIGEDIGKV